MSHESDQYFDDYKWKITMKDGAFEIMHFYNDVGLVDDQNNEILIIIF